MSNLSEYINAGIALETDRRACRKGLYGHVAGRVTAVAKYGVVPGSHGPDYYFVPDESDLLPLWWPGSLLRFTHCHD